MAKVLIADMPWLKPDGTHHQAAFRSGYRWSYTSSKPPILSFRAFPFFLAYASSLLKKAGHDVKCIDSLAKSISLKDFMAAVSELKPDFLLCEIHTPSYNNDRQIVKEIKKSNPDTKIIFCGPHASALPEEVANENEGIADYVIAGEYEPLALKIINGDSTGRIIKGDLIDIDQYPWPDREEFDPSNYNETFCDWPNMHILSSRGCPYQCNFCNGFLMSGRKTRYRNPYDVVEEMRYCIKKWKPREFWFEDDNINASEQKFRKLMGVIHESGLNTQFKAMGHMSISRQSLEMFKAAGGNGMKFGVESINDEVLKRLRKGITSNMIERTLHNCNELGIKTHLTYCIGLPGDTEETIRQTINFAKNNGTTYQISLAAPFPGTPLYDEAKKEGWLNTKSWDGFDGMNDAILSYPNLPSKKIYELYLDGQNSTYKRIFQTGEWKKYLRMIYKERGLRGILKLAKRTDIFKALLR